MQYFLPYESLFIYNSIFLLFNIKDLLKNNPFETLESLAPNKWSTIFTNRKQIFVYFQNLYTYGSVVAYLEPCLFSLINILHNYMLGTSQPETSKCQIQIFKWSLMK